MGTPVRVRSGLHTAAATEGMLSAHEGVHPIAAAAGLLSNVAVGMYPDFHDGFGADGAAGMAADLPGASSEACSPHQAGMLYNNPYFAARTPTSA